MAFIWFSFLLSIFLLILIGRKSIWIGLLTASLVMGILNLSLTEIAGIFRSTITDLPILLLALSVGIIPLIGGALGRSGLIQGLIDSLKMRSKTFLFIAPAFMGMLTMPGGALLSAPVIAKVGKGATPAEYSAINVWFRHVLVMVYPLAGLLATTKMAGLNLYTEVLFLLPGFALLTFLGFYFLLRPIEDSSSLTGSHNLRKIVIPIAIILVAPLIHMLAISIFETIPEELPLFVGVLLSLALSFHFGQLPLSDIGPIIRQMRPWRFFLLIFAMFLFLHIFSASDASEAIAAIAFSPSFLIVAIGIFLGFVTGRVQVPVSILLPIFYARFGPDGMTPLVFAVMYFAVFIGYIVSPIHPCVSVSLEYFQTGLKDFYRKVAAPILIAAVCVSIVSIIFIG